MHNRTAFFWSTGKDSALALYHLLQDQSISVTRLITTINNDLQRVIMHGTPIHLVKRQLKSLNIPSYLMPIETSATMEAYEHGLSLIIQDIKSEGIHQVAFGDIFLEDLKSYRINQMSQLGMGALFPIWKRDTQELLIEFIELGFKAIVVCANEKLGSNFLGREINESFLSELPEGIDPCGENGEFHTFCYDGPIFNKPIEFQLGKKVKHSYPNPTGDGEVNFWFQDLI